LTVDGTLGSSRAIKANVLQGATLDGTGHVSGSVGVKDGTIKAGLVDPSPGILTIDGGLSLTSGSKLEVEIAGTNPGAYSQLVVGGPISLGGSDLEVTLDTAPEYMHAYTIILGLGNTAPTPGFIQGSFVEAAFGGEAYNFGIDYAAGPKGRNVDLIDLTKPAATPEPGTLVQALLAMFGVGLFLAARSRRGGGRSRTRWSPRPGILSPR
jgi:hypothetical protein